MQNYYKYLETLKNLDNIRSIVYIWWRKSDIDKGFVKLGDHTELKTNTNWRESTERYIQQTAAPKEKKTFKDVIEYRIFDATVYASKINRNYKGAKIDNAIAAAAGLNKYRLGRTDQFKLPRFEIDIEEFIEKVQDAIYGVHAGHTLPITNNITIDDIDYLKENKIKTFEFVRETLVIDVLALAKFFDARNLLIISQEDFKEAIFSYYEYNGFLVRENGSKDGQYEWAEKKVMICDYPPEDQSGYDFIFNDFDSTVQVY
jgi:hypothetical protein